MSRDNGCRKSKSMCSFNIKCLLNCEIICVSLSHAIIYIPIIKMSVEFNSQPNNYIHSKIGGISLFYETK